MRIHKGSSKNLYTEMLFILDSEEEGFSFKCDSCPKRFRESTKLNKHKNTHMGELYRFSEKGFTW